MFSGKRFAFLVLLALALAGTSGGATTVNVDFNSSDAAGGSFSGTYTGVAAAPDSGTIWNGVTVGSETGGLFATFTSGNLATSTGVVTGITVSLGNFRAYEANENPAALAPKLMTDFVYQQTLGPGGPNSTFSVNNLDPAQSYDLYLYAQNGGHANTATTFTIHGVTKVASNAGNTGSFGQNVNYALFQGVAPNASGVIAGTFNDFAPANNAAFNGMQIVLQGPPPPPTPPPPTRPGLTAKWADADSVLVFNEIHYHPANEATDTEWIELRSLQGVDVDISGWKLEGGVDFKFPNGTIARGRGFILVAANPGHASLAGLGALGPFTGQLDNGGEELRLVNNSGRVMDRVNYSDAGEWPVGPDGSGATLAKFEEEFADAGPTNWTTSAGMGGTPGALNFAPGARYPGSRFVFNEITGATTSPFRVELLNASTGALDLGGFKIVSSAGGSYSLPAQNVARGAVASFTSLQMGFTPAQGDRLMLLSASGAEFDDARQVTNRLRGRTARGRWAFPTTPGFGTAANTFTINTDVVINEIMYHPHAAQAAQGQWIELHNRGAAVAQLGGWSLGDAVSFNFPAGTTLGPGQYLVVSDNPTSLATHFPGVTILGPFSGELSRGSERLELIDQNNNVVDEVAYFDGGRWPALADGGGSSLERRSPFADGTAPEAWAASNESSRGQWQTVNYSGAGTNALSSDPASWNEFVFGLLDDGSFLIDDISVKEVNQGNRELIQNGTFEGGAASPIWRFLGTHRRATVVPDPDDAGKKVLRIDVTGSTEHISNHAETTLKNSGSYIPISGSSTYNISFRARWVAGCNLLNTRLYFNRLARKTVLAVPAASGTPGAQNSTFIANLGPTYRDLSHYPAVPALTENASVSVRPSDPNGLGAVTLFYAVNGGPFAPAAMNDPDNDGVYTGTVPMQGAGAKVQFYVQAQDGLGATSFFPAGGPNARAMIPWVDGEATGGPAQNLRLTMLGSDITTLHDVTNVMSNDPIGSTVIYRERYIYYDAGVWLKGSERGRAQDIRVGFNLRFPADAPFLGAHQRIAIDRSGAGNEFGQREMLVNHGVARAGNIPGNHADLIRVIAPRQQNTSAAMLFKSRFSDEYLDNQYDQGGDGTLFEYELIYVPLTTNIPSGAGPHWVEGLKIPYPQPDSVQNEPVRDLGVDQELYRWHYLIKNRRQQDDYSKLMSAAASIGLPSGAQFLSEARTKLDVDQWLRTFAAATLFGIGDTYITGGLGHNAQFYVRPSDGKLLLFPWDMDVAFNLGSTSTLTPSPDLQKLIVDPAFKRAYYGHVLDIVNTAFNTTYLTSWAQHYNTYLPGQNLSQYLSYISSRASSAQTQIHGAVAQVPFAITTPNGQPVSAPFATIQGTGWVDVREIRLLGSTEPLIVTWLGSSSFQVTVPIAPDTTSITLHALGFDGTLLATSTITVTTSGTTQPASAANLAITEVMYHPPPPTAAEQMAGYNFPDAEDEFEYVEVQNISAASVNVQNAHFTEGFDYTFPSRVLTPGERIVVARNPAAFALRYPSVPPGSVLGPFVAGKLLDSGESIALVDAGGGSIRSFSFGDSDEWPSAADGDGLSLVLIRPESLPDVTLAQNWRHSALPGGNPAAGDRTTFDAWKSAHSISSDTDDLDLDDAGNFLEYARGTDARLPDRQRVFASLDDDGRLVISFTRRIGADDVSFEAQLSTSLTVWAPDPVILRYAGVAYNADGTETVRYRITNGAPAAARRYLRIKASLLND